MIIQPGIHQALHAPIILALEIPTERDLETINSLSNPPLTKLSLDQIYIRQCRLAGDTVDGWGGCFRTADLPKLLQLVQGAPALIGHNRQVPAVARFFGGSIQEHKGANYIIPKFYWPRKHSEAENLKVLIDAGIMNEASLAFTFSAATCSICGEDIRECSHEIGQKYDDKPCFYWYDGIRSVLEGSFVYRGAEPGTGFLQKPSTAPKSHQLTLLVNGVPFVPSKTT